MSTKESQSGHSVLNFSSFGLCSHAAFFSSSFLFFAKINAGAGEEEGGKKIIPAFRLQSVPIIKDNDKQFW